MTLALRPTALSAALDFLADHPEATPLAGCTDLLVGEPLLRLARPVVVDLGGLGELRGVRRVDDAIEVGALTTMSELRRDELVREHFPALAAAAAEVGGWQIQNRATLGGNVANASPAGDTLPVLLALDTTVLLARAGGRRELPYDAFHLGYRRTALAPGELVTGFRLRVQPPGSRQAFSKVGTRAAQAISKVVVAMSGRVEAGIVTALRLAAGSVAATPVRLLGAEAAVIGQPVDPATATRGGQAAAAEVTPIDDVRSTAEYRRFALERVVRRLLLALAAPT